MPIASRNELLRPVLLARHSSKRALCQNRGPPMCPMYDELREQAGILVDVGGIKMESLGHIANDGSAMHCEVKVQGRRQDSRCDEGQQPAPGGGRWGRRRGVIHAAHRHVVAGHAGDLRMRHHAFQSLTHLAEHKGEKAALI